MIFIIPVSLSVATEAVAAPEEPAREETRRPSSQSRTVLDAVSTEPRRSPRRFCSPTTPVQPYSLTLTTSRRRRLDGCHEYEGSTKAKGISRRMHHDNKYICNK